jgi:hypothetical protein
VFKQEAEEFRRNLLKKDKLLISCPSCSKTSSHEEIDGFFSAGR